MKIEKTFEQQVAHAPEDLPKGIQITDVCQGLKVWHNPVNKFAVIRLHYSADPKKRTQLWKENARAGLTYAEWMREYEIFFSSFDGVPVYLDDYSRDFHVAKEPLVWAPEYPIIRGWDFGLSAQGMACIFAQLLPPFRLFIYKELTASDTDFVNFCPAVKRKSLEWFRGCQRFIDIVDPSGFHRSQLDKRTCVKIIKDTLKTKPIAGETSIVKRRKSVVEFLQGTVKGLPRLIIDAEGAGMLIEGFDGGYHYAYQKDGQVKDTPEKNEYSHPHDALQMICSRASQIESIAEESGHVVFATPGYGFGR